MEKSVKLVRFDFLKGDLSIYTILDPPNFLLDTPFKYSSSLWLSFYISKAIW
jgi:hypothetical protein